MKKNLKPRDPVALLFSTYVQQFLTTNTTQFRDLAKNKTKKKKKKKKKQKKKKKKKKKNKKLETPNKFYLVLFLKQFRK